MVGCSGWGWAVCDLGGGVEVDEVSEYLIDEDETLAEKRGVGGSSALVIRASRASRVAFREIGRAHV